MTALEQKAMSIYKLLPEQEQIFAYEFIKRLVLAWDPDFTKVTPEEQAILDEAEIDWQEGNVVDPSEIDW